MEKNSFIKFRLYRLIAFPCILLFNFIAFTQCNTPVEKEHPIEDTHILYSNYENSKGIVIHKHIKVQTRLTDAIQEFEQFQSTEFKEYNAKVEASAAKAKENLDHLNVDGWKFITPKGILILSFTAAIFIPIPGTFETLTTVGFITMGVQRLIETEKSKAQRIKLTDVLAECSEAYDKLTHLHKTTFPDFKTKWTKIFYNKDNHVKNTLDPTDIRVYDTVWNRYKNERENLKSMVNIELEHANNQCSYSKLE
jgi:hypothetical protein